MLWLVGCFKQFTESVDDLRATVSLPTYLAAERLLFCVRSKMALKMVKLEKLLIANRTWSGDSWRSVNPVLIADWCDLSHEVY